MATLAPPPSPPRPTETAPATVPSGDTYWVVSGVAGELARRLRASVLFIRVLLVIVSFALAWWVIAVYAAAALLLPQGGRRLPGWRNVVGLSRLGLLTLIFVALQGFSLLGAGLFGHGPSVWIPFGAAILTGVITLFGGGRRAADSDDERDRHLVLASIPAAVLAAVLGVGILVAPALRWDLVLDLGLVVVGASLAWAGRRDARDMPMIPYLALALLAIVLASSGARLQGGVGDLRAAPRGLAPLYLVYRRAIGSETLDLSALRGDGSRVARVDASVGIGNLTLTLPAHADGSVDVRVGSGGWIGDYPRSPSSGFDLHSVLPANPDGHPASTARSRLHLRIAAHVGRGCVTISRAGSGFSTSGCS